MSDKADTQKGKKAMETDVLVMGGLTILMVDGLTRGKDLPLRGLQTGLGLLQGVWLPLLFGFYLAGIFEVLISWELLATWMGATSPTFRASCSGGWWACGGPYVVFPLAASLLKEVRRRGPTPIALRVLARYRVRLDYW
ncbi:hypothetical protein [Candidatus Methylomirabilis sp.]|uniref:hypothetical protein n=1 Tax=Candidatus Methylomirabilis sp. TaxID=2032687 RepID=UPI003C725E6D